MVDIRKIITTREVVFWELGFAARDPLCVRSAWP
jgi:hypothetical protein